ncbi:exportin-4 isoform X2 [Lasioglossum baleicum]|uniref:exportin-4 isoform X2 n=1 Tax=Lasioglossum baleicum TaxID=434251 RepID=UPI003FCCCB7E
MAEQIINKLEKAAQVILAPPNLSTVEQRQSADEVFLNFRKTKSPYQLCRQILETNTNDYILFEAAGLLKIALVEEWSNLPKEDISALRQYLLHYTINKPQLAPYIKGKILQVIAIIIKRNRSNDSGQEQQQFLDQVENLIMTGDLARKVLGCNLISAVLQEYKFDAKTSNIGYSMEIHYAEKVAFERENVKRIFKFCLGILDELIKKDAQDDTLALLKHLLPILETIFTWPIICKMLRYNIFNNMLDDEHVDLRLDESWQDVILPPRVQDLFFTLYWKIRGNPQLAHLARICLVQLGTLDGPIFSSKEMKIEYFSNYTRRFLEFITNIAIIDQEAPGIARIVENLTKFVSKNFTTLPEDMVKAFMEQLCRLTCLYVENSAQEEFLYASECLYSEGLDILFGVWIGISSKDVNFLPNEKGIFDEFCKQSFTRIFTTYVQCHLCPPEGVRNLDEKDLNKKEDENEEDDKDRFKEKLQAIGCFGREILNHSLSLLSHLIKDRTSKLREILNKLVGQVDSLSTLNDTYACKLYEDIHWLLLISGHVLCMESIGEIALIPSEINDYSKEQANQGKVDINVTSQLLVASENVSSDLNVAVESVDHVIHFVTDIFRLCAIEKTAISVRLDSILSPVLSCTILWFLNRWANSYLLPRESYEVPSTTFLEVFGEGSSGATWAINFLLDKIEYSINAFRSEPTIMHETIKLLKSLVVSQKKAPEILKSERFRPIWNMAVRGQYDFPSEVKRGLIQVVIVCIFADPDSKKEGGYWPQALLQPLRDRCIQITSDEKFLKSYQQEEIKFQIIDILERFIGVAQGCQHVLSSSKILIQYMFPVLEKLPNLLSLYHNYQQIVQLILELLSECSRVTIPLHLSVTEESQIHQVFLNTMKSYIRYNNNRFAINLDEEDNYQDIQFIMEMLYDLSLSATMLVDVFLCGLNIITPIVTINLLQFPILCSLYYKMITSFCANFSDKACSLPPELMRPMLESLEWGLFSTINGIPWLCCNIISYLAEHIYSHTPNDHPRNQMLAPFLKLLMTALFTQEIDEGFISAAHHPLYHLIICYQEEYKQLVQNILGAQSDQQIVHRLADAFTKLTANPYSTSVNYEDTIVSVRLILMVK